MAACQRAHSARRGWCGGRLRSGRFLDGAGGLARAGTGSPVSGSMEGRPALRRFSRVRKANSLILSRPRVLRASEADFSVAVARARRLRRCRGSNRSGLGTTSLRSWLFEFGDDAESFGVDQIGAAMTAAGAGEPRRLSAKTHGGQANLGWADWQSGTIGFTQVRREVTSFVAFCGTFALVRFLRVAMAMNANSRTTFRAHTGEAPEAREGEGCALLDRNRTGRECPRLQPSSRGQNRGNI